MELKSSAAEVVIPGDGVVKSGSSLEEVITLHPPGEYDPEKQLTGEQVVELKERFADSFTLLPDVCAYIAMELVKTFEEITSQPPEDFAMHLAKLSAHWAQFLQMAISLPGSEWPADMTPPATFAEAIKALEQNQ